MKFLCVDCDEQMTFTERKEPGDGTFAASFTCPACGRSVAMLANPMETQLVGALGVRIGGRELDEEPMEFVRKNVKGRDDAFADAEPPLAGRPVWTAEAEERLGRVPGFVRGMVKKIYGEYAADRGIAEITPAVMDQARIELGLEGDVAVAERVIGGLTVRIDELLCVGFGDCVGVAPEVFVLNGDGTVDFIEVVSADPERLLEAARVCPVDALTVADGSGRQLVP